MQKRVQCAAFALGRELTLGISNSVDAYGLRYEETPVLIHQGSLVLNGLLPTEEIEPWLLGFNPKG